MHFCLNYKKVKSSPGIRIKKEILACISPVFLACISPVFFQYFPVSQRKFSSAYFSSVHFYCWRESSPGSLTKEILLKILSFISVLHNWGGEGVELLTVSQPLMFPSFNSNSHNSDKTNGTNGRWTNCPIENLNQFVRILEYLINYFLTWGHMVN